MYPPPVLQLLSAQAEDKEVEPETNSDAPDALESEESSTEDDLTMTHGSKSCTKADVGA